MGKRERGRDEEDEVEEDEGEKKIGCEKRRSHAPNARIMYITPSTGT